MIRSIEHEMRQLLARMALIQYGSVTAWASSGRGVPSSRPPTGESVTLAEHWAGEWDRDPSETTITKARAALDAWVRRSSPVETDESTLEDWVIDDGEGFAVAQVAGKFGLAESRVRRIRLKAGRESEFGLPTVFAQHREPMSDKAARIRNLASQGCTLRQIELQTGVPRETVRRWMRAAA